MKFDASQHRCTIVINNQLPAGLAMNAASVIGLGLGHRIENLLGPDRQSADSVNYPGVIYSPLPVLLAEATYLQQLQEAACRNDGIFVMPFSALAQSCKTYEEYGERLARAASHDIELVAIGLVGPKRTITTLTGNLPLYR